MRSASSGKRKEKGWLGAVLTVNGQPWKVTRWQVPHIYTERLKSRGNYIQFLEMCSSILAITTFADELKDANTILYCDNNGQLGALIRGFSREWDYSVVAGVFWRIACFQSMSLQLARVPSVENVADIPSRPKDTLGMGWLRSRGSIFVKPGDMTELLASLKSMIPDA